MCPLVSDDEEENLQDREFSLENIKKTFPSK